MSEIIDGLERKRLLARMRDARDRRRTLVWITDEGRAAMAQEREVLCGEMLESALAGLSETMRTNLLQSIEALVTVSAKLKRQPRRIP